MRLLLPSLFALTCFACNVGLSEREWPWGAGAPATPDINGDGVEDILEDRRIRLIDGKTFERVWLRQELDVRATAIVGDVLAVAVPRGLHLLGLRDGVTRHALTLADEVRQLCADGDGVWLSLIDEATVRVDARTGAQTAGGARPARCAPAPPRLDACWLATAQCEGTDHQLVLRAGVAQAEIWVKERGTPEVTLRFGDRPVSLHHDLRLRAAELVGDTLFLKLTGVVAAFDVATGVERWKSACAGDSRQLRVTATRVYAECDGSKTYKALLVLDHAGKRLATFGRPR